MKAAKPFYTLADLAERWCCSHSTVLTHVRQGTLQATDISTNPHGRSRYIVPAEEVERFEESRRTPPPPQLPSSRRNRVKVRPGEVIEFFS